MILMLFMLLLVTVVLISLGKYKATIYCFAITLILAIGEFLTHTTKDLPLQL